MCLHCNLHSIRPFLRQRSTFEFIRQVRHKAYNTPQWIPVTSFVPFRLTVLDRSSRWIGEQKTVWGQTKKKIKHSLTHKKTTNKEMYNSEIIIQALLRLCLTSVLAFRTSMMPSSGVYSNRYRCKYRYTPQHI